MRIPISPTKRLGVVSSTRKTDTPTIPFTVQRDYTRSNPLKIATKLIVKRPQAHYEVCSHEANAASASPMYHEEIGGTRSLKSPRSIVGILLLGRGGIDILEPA